MLKKKIMCVILLTILISIYMPTYSKYSITKTLEVAKIDVDRRIPYIIVNSVINSNPANLRYATEKETIKVIFYVMDNRKLVDEVTLDEIEIWVGDNKVEPKEITLKEESSTNTSRRYSIQMKGIRGEGELKIKFLSKMMADSAGWYTTQYFAGLNIKMLISG